MKSGSKEKSKVLENLNKQQEQAITFGQGSLLIIAGAGTGKTTVLTRRIVWLIEQGLAKPEEILALTFTEKAAAEMDDRVDLLMPLGYADISISTFHAFAQKILTQHALDIGLPGDFQVITDTQAWIMVKKNLADFDLDYYRPIGNPDRFIHALIQHFGKAKGEEITPEDYLKYAEGLRLAGDSVEIKKRARRSKQKTVSSNQEVDPAEAARVLEVANAYHQYQKLLLDHKFLDFGDLINYTLRLFRTRPKVLEFYQKQFKYVLVDEFQDTDWSQYELVKMLAVPENNITVVGDDDQSIYKFRGASVSNILKFKQDYPKASEITLTENYRSTQPILDLSYKFIQQNNPERLEPKLQISKQLTSNLNQTGEIKVIHAQTVYSEARQTVDKIIELVETHHLNFNDFAILVRANNHAESFLLELARRGIPYIFVANRGLYKKPFILDILAYLGLLDNYHETDKLFRVLSLPKFKIADSELISYSQLAKRKAWSLFEALQSSTNPKVLDLMRLLNRHTQLARDLSATEVIVKILGDLDLLKSLMEETAANLERRSLLEKFYQKAQDFERDSDDKSLKGFLRQIELELAAGDLGELAFDAQAGPEAVRVMTVHAAKGLEFNCVFIVNLVDQRFPSTDRKEQIEVPQPLVKEILPVGDVHLMEERRLFYVAATRAKRFLYLTWADDYGGQTKKKPSKFLVELGLAEQRTKEKPKGEVFFTVQPKLPQPEVTYSLPQNFSFSQISTFLHCPLEYKYKYVYHLPLPGAAQLSFGVTIHNTLEKFLKNMIQINSAGQADLFGPRKAKELQIPPKDLLPKFYAESWVDDWFPNKSNKEEYRKKGLKLLDNFYQKIMAEAKLPKFLEKPFKLKLGQYKFTGKIDRADLNADGSIDIVDYKTGSARKDLSKVDKQQLMIYQWAAEEEFGERVRSLSYWYLDNLEAAEPFLGEAGEITDLKAKLLSDVELIIDTIQTNNFEEADRRISHDCQFRHFES